MKKNLLHLLLLICIATTIKAQAKLGEPINSGINIEKFYELSAEQKCDEALILLNQINEGDTNYITSLIKKTLCLIDLKKYDEAIAVCDSGLIIENNPEKQVFWLNKGYILSLQEKHEAALEEYLALKKAFPFYRNVSNNLAYQYINTKEYATAYEAYKKHVEVYPFDVNGHINVGLFAYHEGKYAESLMAMNIAILLDPYSDKSLSILKLINDLSNNTKVDKIPKEGFKWESDEYDEINLLFENYVALNEKYKVKTKSSLYLAKQNHMIFNSLSKLKVSDYFFSSYYAPFYIQLVEQKWFDQMQLTELLASQNEVHVKLVEKNKKDIEAFLIWFRKTWYDLQNKATLSINNHEKEYQLWFKSSGNLDAIGNRNKNNNNEGDFIFLHNTGSILSEGKFVDGKRDGLWKIFYENGNIKQRIKYSNGDIIDTIYIYYENGAINEKAEFSNENRNGAFEEYYNNERLYRKGTYKDGLFDGDLIYYFKNGNPEYELTYKDGKLNGLLVEKYADGSVYRKENFTNGKSNGAYELFWPDGSKKSVGNKVDDLFEGAYISYSQNGEIHFKGTYLKGEKTGEWTTYYANGAIKETENFTNGILNGFNKLYDYDGKIYAEKEMKDNWLISYTYFDKTGKVLSNGGDSKKPFLIENYYPHGVIVSKGMFQKDIGKIGKWEEFDEYGNLSFTYNNEDGKIEGEANYYHPWGLKRKTLNYKEGELNGYFAEYYQFNQIKQQGYYSNGNLDGVWKIYYPDGTLEQSLFYINGKKNGKDFNYCVNGKLDFYREYEDGMVVGAAEYDTLGKIYNQFKFKNFEGDFIRKHYNSKIAYKGSYTLNLAEGEFIWYYPNGKVQTKGDYLNSQEDGSWEWFFEDGSKKTVGTYKNGQKIGTWNYYFSNGTLSETEEYVFGYLHGLDQQFHENGKLSSEIDYEFDEYHGAYKFYSPLEELQVARVYDRGRLDHYYYLNDNLEKVIKPIEKGNAEVVGYYPNGKKSRIFNLTKGYFEGPYQAFHSNGQIAIDYKLENDDKLGEYKKYFANGKIQEEINYYYDYRVGLTKEYHENGQLKKTINYHYGVMHGAEKTFDQNGKLVSTVYYYDGVKYED